MYKNIIFFFFSFINQNVRMGRARWVEDDWAALTGAKVRIFGETSSLPSVRVEVIPEA